MEKTSTYTAVKKTPIPDIEEVMTIDAKKAEIADVESFLAVKQAELAEMQALGIKSEAEEALLETSDVTPPENNE